jgi:hypothetical protein
MPAVRGDGPGGMTRPARKRTGPVTVTGETWTQSPEAVAVVLSMAFPSYAVTVRRDRGTPRFQLISRDGTNHPYCLISPDAQEIWRELGGQ